MGELLPPGQPSPQAQGKQLEPGVWSGVPGDPYDPYYAQFTDVVDLLMGIAQDVRLSASVRAKYGCEALPYVRSRMGIAPYRPPDHDGRIFIEVVKFSKEDFQKP